MNLRSLFALCACSFLLASEVGVAAPSSKRPTGRRAQGVPATEGASLSSEKSVNGQKLNQSGAILDPNNPVESKVTGTLSARPDKKKEKPMSVSFGFSHLDGFYENTEPTTSFFVTGTYKFNDKQSASVSQSFNQAYRVNPGVDDKGFKQNDTLLSFRQMIAQDFLKSQWSGLLSSTLPISERSNRIDNYTITTATLTVSKAFLEKRLTLSLSPMARYYFNEFKTTPSYQGSGGGNPLPHYLYGATTAINYKWTDKLSTFGSAGWTEQHLHETQFENPDPLYGFTAPPQNSYSLSAGMSFLFTKQWSGSLSYAHGDRYEKPWGTEYLVFNDRVSTWSVGSTFTW